MLPEDRSQHLGEELQGWAQAAGRRGKDWEFPCVVKVVLWGALPYSGFSWASFPWHGTLTHLRLTLGLTQFEAGEPIFSVHLWKWREPAAKTLEAKLCPSRWGPWRRVSALLSCSWPCESRKGLAGTCFLRLRLFPQGLFSWLFRVCAAHLSGIQWAIIQHLWGIHRLPCSKGFPSSLSLPCFVWWTHCSLQYFVSHHRY